MHNAPKIYYTVLSQSFQQLSGISRIAYPGERSPFPSWNKNGIDAVNHRSCRTSYIIFPPKEPTEFANTSNEISKKEEGREKRNSRSRNIDIRNPRKQKHSGTCTGFTSFSFLYSEERQTFRNIYPVALHSIENLVSLFCNRSPRYVIARAPSKQPRSQGSIKCVHSHDLHSEYGIAGTAHRLVRVAFNRDGWLLPCGQRQIIPPALKFILYLLLAFVLSNRACVCARILGKRTLWNDSERLPIDLETKSFFCARSHFLGSVGCQRFSTVLSLEQRRYRNFALLSRAVVNSLAWKHAFPLSALVPRYVYFYVIEKSS